MNSVNFNVVTPNVNYARLSDESTDKPTEQVNFKCKKNLTKKSSIIIDELNDKAIDLLNKKRPVAEQKEIALKKSVGLFFRSFSNFFGRLKKIGTANKNVDKNQQVVDFASDAANYFENRRLGRKELADIYKERMRKFLEE